MTEFWAGMSYVRHWPWWLWLSQGIIILAVALAMVLVK